MSLQERRANLLVKYQDQLNILIDFINDIHINFMDNPKYPQDHVACLHSRVRMFIIANLMSQKILKTTNPEADMLLLTMLEQFMKE